MSSQPSWIPVARLLAFVFWLLSGLLWAGLAVALLKDLLHWQWDFYAPVAIPMLLAALILPFVASFLWGVANKKQGVFGRPD